MPRFGVSVEKTVSFRGFPQPFANVYYYNQPDIAVDALVTLENLLDIIVAEEKEMFAGVVSFVRGRVWNTGSGSQAGNQMRIDKALAGVGAALEHAVMDRERAFLFRWPAGTDSRGKPVYLRKWYHLCSQFGGAVADDVLANRAAIPLNIRQNLEAQVAQFRSPTAGGFNFDLVAQSGRVTTGGVECHRYLEHRQLGDQWR